MSNAPAPPRRRRMPRIPIRKPATTVGKWVARKAVNTSNRLRNARATAVRNREMAEAQRNLRQAGMAKKVLNERNRLYERELTVEGNVRQDARLEKSKRALEARLSGTRKKAVEQVQRKLVATAKLQNARTGFLRFFIVPKLFFAARVKLLGSSLSRKQALIETMVDANEVLKTTIAEKLEADRNFARANVNHAEDVIRLARPIVENEMIVLRKSEARRLASILSNVKGIFGAENLPEITRKRIATARGAVLRITEPLMLMEFEGLLQTAEKALRRRDSKEFNEALDAMGGLGKITNSSSKKTGEVQESPRERLLNSAFRKYDPDANEETWRGIQRQAELVSTREEELKRALEASERKKREIEEANEAGIKREYENKIAIRDKRNELLERKLRIANASDVNIRRVLGVFVVSPGELDKRVKNAGIKGNKNIEEVTKKIRALNGELQKRVKRQLKSSEQFKKRTGNTTKEVLPEKATEISSAIIQQNLAPARLESLKDLKRLERIINSQVRVRATRETLLRQIARASNTVSKTERVDVVVEIRALLQWSSNTEEAQKLKMAVAAMASFSARSPTKKRKVRRK